MSLSETRQRLSVAAAAAAAFGCSLCAQGWPRDDRWLILEHPLIRAGWPAADRLLASGYVQPLLGARTPIHEWRPLLSLSFLLQRVTTGFAPFPFHAVNLALHIGVCLLVLEVLRRRLGSHAALAGALVFAVLPVHAEVVAYISSRSELLAALSVLGAWIILDSPNPSAGRLAAGAAVFLAGALSKEHVLLFPLFLMMSDHAFHGRLPWQPGRLRVYAALAAAAALVLAGRAAVLPALAHGGVPYFTTASPLSRILTLSKFWVWHYLRPAVTGLGLCSDFSRPLIPDSSSADVAAWICLLLLLALSAAALRAFARRRPWGFWVLAPCLFLLPTSHLLMDLDTLGAQRFLYLPSLGLAAAAGWAFQRAEETSARAARVLFASIAIGLGGRAAWRAADWHSDLAYDRAAVACNPVSVKARAALGTDFLRAGQTAEGERILTALAESEPTSFDARFDLARLAYDRRDLSAARTRLDAAREIDPDAASGLVLQALLDESAGRLEDAERSLRRCVELAPDDATARYDLARVLARLGRPREAAEQLRRFLWLAPQDPDAPRARVWLRGLEGSSASPAGEAGRS